MRIISGRYKGRTIKMPKGIRPTQDKVRKALFDILGDVEDLSFLELFAGCGAIGFEALSRGVADLTLVECNRDCLLAIKKNIASLATKACSLYPQEVEKAIHSLHRNKRKFDIIFLDPPYYGGLVPRFRPSLRSGLEDDSEQSEESRSGSKVAVMGESLSKKTLQTLGAYDILAPNGFIVVQHFKKDNLPDRLGDLVLFKQAKYGDTILSFYRKVSRLQ